MNRKEVRNLIDSRIDLIGTLGASKSSEVAKILEDCFKKFLSVPIDNFPDQHDAKNFLMAGDNLANLIEIELMHLRKGLDAYAHDDYFQIRGTLAMLSFALKE